MAYPDIAPTIVDTLVPAHPVVKHQIVESLIEPPTPMTIHPVAVSSPIKVNAHPTVHPHAILSTVEVDAPSTIHPLTVSSLIDVDAPLVVHPSVVLSLVLEYPVEASIVDLKTLDPLALDHLDVHLSTVDSKTIDMVLHYFMYLYLVSILSLYTFDLFV